MLLQIILIGLFFSMALAFAPVPLVSRLSPNRSFHMSSVTPSDIIGQKVYDAAYAGNVEKLKNVLAECKGNKAALNWRNMERYGRTPLVIAAYYNKIESVKLLLATSGVDVNASSDFGATG